MAFGLVLGCSIPTLRLARPRLHHHRLYFANFIYSNNRGLLQHLPRRSALQRPSRPLLVPYILRLGCALPSTSGIGNIGVCLHPGHAARSGKPGTCLGLGGLTASSLLPPRHITVFVYCASALPLFCAPLCANGFMCDYLCIGYLGTYLDHYYFKHGVIDHGYKLSSRLAPHRHKGLSSA